MINQIKFFRFNDDVGVVAIKFDCFFSDIKDKLDFAISNNLLPKEDWQTMYMEQYFDVDNNYKIVDTYNEPDDNVSNFWIYFFIHDLKVGQTLVSDNFGNFLIEQLEALPKETKRLLDFAIAD